MQKKMQIQERKYIKTRKTTKKLTMVEKIFGSYLHATCTQISCEEEIEIRPHLFVMCN